jgi:hypothetical protein
VLHCSSEARLAFFSAIAHNGGADLASPEELVAQVTRAAPNFLRYIFIFQAFAGLLLIGLAYFMGAAHFHLIRAGIRAPGKIVGYKQQYFTGSSGSTSSTTTGYMPIVEFQAEDRVVQFQDWLGAKIAGTANVSVMVLYDPVNPSVAMIDRPVWNWIPWAPTFAVGVFLVLVVVRGALRSLSV